MQERSVWLNLNETEPDTPFLQMGSGDRDRTCDTRLMSPLLYRLSYATTRCKGYFVVAYEDYNIIPCQGQSAKATQTSLSGYSIKRFMALTK